MIKGTSKIYLDANNIFTVEVKTKGQTLIWQSDKNLPVGLEVELGAERYVPTEALLVKMLEVAFSDFLNGKVELNPELLAHLLKQKE